jgi:predicted ATP-dependent protease
LSPKPSKAEKEKEGKSGFVPVKARWVIERSNSWMERCKSLVKNFERTLKNATFKINLCFVRLMFKRLAIAQDDRDPKWVLYEASALVEPLFANIQTEVREKTLTIDLGTQQLINGLGEFQVIRQKLNRVVTLHDKMNNLIENIAKSVENQTRSSAFAKDSIQEVASIAERISEQSMTITQSFNQLVVLVQKL